MGGGINSANAILEEWITRYGCPASLITDQGTEFVNSVWSQLMDRLEIQKKVLPTYNPQSNLVERWHRTLNAILRCYLNRNDKSWSRYLSTAIMAYNTKVNDVTGLSPYECWFGRKPRLPIDLVLPLPNKSYLTEDAFITDTMRRFELMYKKVRKNAEARFHRNAKQYSNADQWKVGDLVWVYSKRRVLGKPGKITDAWVGPYKIIAKPAEVLVEVIPAERAGRKITKHVTTLKRYNGMTGINKERTPLAIADDDADDLAEEIGQPERWVEPTDLAVPTQLPVPETEMIDLSKLRQRSEVRKRKPDESAVGAESKHTRRQGEKRGGEEALATTTKTGKYQGEKRGAEETLATTTKTGKYQGEKRDREGDTDPDTRVTRSKTKKTTWQRLVMDTTSDDEGNNSPELLSSDDEVIKSLAEAQATAAPHISVAMAPGITAPTRGSSGAAGWDLRASQNVTIQPGACCKVDIGLRLEIPQNWALILFSRSKLAHEGIVVEGGVIDSDYRGRILCLVHNQSLSPKKIQQGERICQGLFLPVPEVQFYTRQLTETIRGHNGFGSTNPTN